MRNTRRRVREIRVPENCPYCKEKTEPDYKDFSGLGKYMTERGKVLGKKRSGLCATHQRQIKRSISRARYIGLLPFVVLPR